MPGRWSLFIASSFFIGLGIESFLEANDDADRLGVVDFMAHSIPLATLLGLAVRIFVLNRQYKTGKRERKPWSRNDNLITLTILAVVSFFYFFGLSGICISEGRKLSDEELIRHALVGPGYYYISKGHNGLFGAYSVYVTTYTLNNSHDGGDTSAYTENDVHLNACGVRVGKALTMGHSLKDMESVKKYFKEKK
jgi:hypothetical protein